MTRSEDNKSGEAGEIFGRYLLSHRIGTGGMGVVHEATWIGPEGVARPVCVKRIRPGAGAGEARIRLFVDEARLSMGLSHGNVVQTLDFGRVGDEWFLALELVDGTDLGTLLAGLRREGAAMPPDVAAFVAAAMCDGLGYAHGRGVVHRDVKPGNVLLSRAGEVKIADFGVAALADGARGVRGTAAYMAPEQARGEPTDARADLYATGLVLYEMLAGHSARGVGDEAAVLARAKEGGVPRLDDAPETLVAIVARATDPDPAKRPKDARELGDALGAFVAGARAAGAEPPTRWLQARAGAVPAGRLERARSTAPASEREDRSSTYFTRDGAAADFVTRMAETRAEIPAPPTARRWVWVTAVLAGLGALALWGISGEESRRPESALRPRSAPRTSEPVQAPLPPSEPEHALAPPPATQRRSRPATTRAAPSTPSLVSARSDPAIVDCNARPYAAVWIDGVRRGETPLVGVSLSAGEHTVRLVHDPSGREWTTRVTLSPGERRSITADLRVDRDAGAR